jgi:hypothetical protein
MQTSTVSTPQNWLAFELNVLRRLKFNSIAIPFTTKPALGKYLKQWDVKVLSNNLLKSDYIKTKAMVENNDDQLGEKEIEIILEDAYVPHYQLKNNSLRNWFNETDSWWFDNIRANIEKLPSPMARALALNYGMSVGDYVLSFDDETRELRQPLSNVFKRFWSVDTGPVNNGLNNVCQNKSPNEFTAENYTDLMFLRLPQAHNQTLKKSLGKGAWREEWIRGNGDIWNELESEQLGKLGIHIETKSQYLNLLEDLFKTASHIELWAVAHVEDSFVQTQDIVETISRVRRVDTIFTKDFSELLGTKAVIITA